MNSVMTVGKYIAFIYKGKKLWEGNKNTILESGVKELDEFIFASKLINDLKFYKLNFANGV